MSILKNKISLPKFITIFLLVFMPLYSLMFSCDRLACDRISTIYTNGNDLSKTLEIPFDSLKTIGSTLNYFENEYCGLNQEKMPILFFNLSKNKIVKSAGNAMPVFIEPTPCNGTPEYDFNQILEINLDGNNVLVEDKRIPIDSIPQYVYYQYLNYGARPGFSRQPEGNGIWLITERARSMSDFNEIIGAVLTGYRESIEFLSKALFGKPICQLDEKEWFIISHKMQFHLAIKYSDEIEPAVIIQ